MGKKRIGILTFHRPVNYGAFLQAFALSNEIQKAFPESEVEIVDYIAPKEKMKRYINVLSQMKHHGLANAVVEFQKVRRFSTYIRFLKTSPMKLCTYNLNKLFGYINSNYDLLIIGSDAVFNWNQNGFPSAFIPDFDFKIPVMTYAASVHGLAYYSEENPKIDLCCRAFKRMKFIGVRDYCTEKFVQYCCAGAKTVHCCDPTFVLDHNILTAIKHRDNLQLLEQVGLGNQKEYIVLMLQDERTSKIIYESYSDKYNIVSVFKPNKYTDAFMGDLSPVEWSLLLKNARLVVTNYFHGTLLALTQETPAVVVDISHYNGRYEGKMKDLMVTRLSLPELYFPIEDINIDEIVTQSQKCLDGQYNERIRKGVNSEKKTFGNFLNQIRDCGFD